MNRYNQGKIYKLVNDVDAEIYVGSTCMPLAKRKSSHKTDAKRKPNQHVYAHLNTIGWENVRIVLIESVNAETRDQLLMREQHYIDLLKPSLNKKAAHVDCPHNRQKPQCKDCGGSQICEHGKQKAQCKDCLGDTYYCYECERNFANNSRLNYHLNSKKHKLVYDVMVLDCFGTMP